MAIESLHAHRQIPAIKRTLATAPKIQEDLKNYSSFLTEPYETFGLEDSVFGIMELVGLRRNHTLSKIAEDFDVKSRYGIKSNDVAERAVGSAFRGHHNEDFMPKRQIDGLFGKELNDYIKDIKDSIDGRKAGLITWEKGLGYHGRTPEEMFEHGRKLYERGEGIFKLTPEELSRNGQKGYANGLANLTTKELSENSRKGAELMGHFLWLEEDRSRKPELDTLEEKVEESIGEGHRNNMPSWDSATTNFNEATGLDMSKGSLQVAHYKYNKNRIADEEE